MSTSAPAPDSAGALQGWEVRYVRGLGRWNNRVAIFALLWFGGLWIWDLLQGGSGRIGLPFNLVFWPPMLLTWAGNAVRGTGEDIKIKNWVLGLCCGGIAGGWAAILLRNTFYSEQLHLSAPYAAVCAMGLADLFGLWVLRRAYPVLVREEVERASPKGALPMAGLAVRAAEVCAAAGWSGILWVCLGLFWGLTGDFGPKVRFDLPPVLHIAGVAGGVGGGLALLVSRFWIMRGVVHRTRGLQRGLWLSAAGGPFGGVLLYLLATVGLPSTAPFFARVIVFVVPLIVPAFAAVCLIVMGKVYAARTELRELERELCRPAGERAEGEALEDMCRRAEVLRGMLGEPAPDAAAG